MNSNRNYGIDLLRMTAMFMVCILHTLGQGGILSAVKASTAQFWIAWFLESAAYCAVNCYALISGYVGIDAGYKISNIMKLWLQVAFYSIGMTVAAFLIDKTLIAEGDWQAAFFPVLTKNYWYFTAYFCMFFFIPFLNTLVNTLSEKMRWYLCGVIAAIFSVLPLLAGKDIFLTGRGYSAIWLGMMYLIGAVIKKEQQHLQRISTWTCAGIYIVCVSITGIFRGLLAYDSPTIVLAGIALLLLFSNLNLSGRQRKVVSLLSPLAFSVYLIHVNRFVWRTVLKGRFAAFAEYSPMKFLLAVFAAAFSVYAICSLIDMVRFMLFQYVKKRTKIGR